MSEFPLIQSLGKTNDKTPLPKGHKYQKYMVVVEGQKLVVHIPLKETETFETTWGDRTSMDKYSFNKLMREVRGIRG